MAFQCQVEYILDEKLPDSGLMSIGYNPFGCGEDTFASKKSITFCPWVPTTHISINDFSSQVHIRKAYRLSIFLIPSDVRETIEL